MRKLFGIMSIVLLIFAGAACSAEENTADNITEESTQEVTESEISVSEKRIRISSQDHTAVFQLYDTEATNELYEQLPLELELSNAQQGVGVFDFPEELPVNEYEIGKSGQKGEMGYKEGNILLLYEDVASEEDLYRLGVGLEGIENISLMSGRITIEKIEETQPENEIKQITVEGNGHSIVFELNDSLAASELYEQLPLTIETENFSTNEKIFYPLAALNVSDAPLAQANISTLAYYEPWGDVVMFYGDFQEANGLYELGHVIEGEEYISELSGTISITQAAN